MHIKRATNNIQQHAPISADAADTKTVMQEFRDLLHMLGEPACNSRPTLLTMYNLTRRLTTVVDQIIDAATAATVEFSPEATNSRNKHHTPSSDKLF
jgi:hypothetical protein